MKEIKRPCSKIYRKWKKLKFWYNYGGFFLLFLFPFYGILIPLISNFNYNILVKILLCCILILMIFLQIRGFIGCISDFEFNYQEFLHKE